MSVPALSSKSHAAANRTRAYFDHAATTPLLPEVALAMEPFWARAFGNASSPYAVAREARAAIDRARSQVARLVGAHPDEVAFTGGGTESDNWALLGVALANLQSTRKHVLLASIEHHAVLEAASTLRELGFEPELIPCNSDGVIEAESVRSMLRAETCLVSVMAINNETGVIQPIESIAQEVRAFEVRHQARVILHTDAVQAAGKIPVSLYGWDVDLATLSAHKIGGPKGVGALWIRRGEAGRETSMRALVRGGGQERGRRAGTENVPGIVGFGAASEIARRDLESLGKYLLGLRERLEARLSAWPNAVIHGERSLRAPHVVCFALPQSRAESVALRLDMAGFAVGTGSACASGAIEPSHVLQAMGVSSGEAKSSLRVSFGIGNSVEEVDALADELEAIVPGSRKYLRSGEK